MSKFWKDLEKAAILYMFSINPTAIRFMNTNELRAFLYDDKE